MRHGKKINHLGRTSSHRKALLANMASSLILHKRITTTVAKAKALRKYVEPILNRAKNDNMQARRVAFGYLQNKEVVKELFDVIADKIANRMGGYTRIIRLGTRIGDNAEICMMELVDFNELMQKDTTTKKTRRSRRSKGGKKADETTSTTVESQDTPSAEVEEGK
jgi:large subunit ribosomal protein L17